MGRIRENLLIYSRGLLKLKILNGTKPFWDSEHTSPKCAGLDSKGCGNCFAGQNYSCPAGGVLWPECPVPSSLEAMRAIKPNKEAPKTAAPVVSKPSL